MKKTGLLALLLALLALAALCPTAVFAESAPMIRGGEGSGFSVSEERLLALGLPVLYLDTEDGDYIIVQESHEANNGEIVVALVNDGFESGATVKRFYKEADYIRLQPENDSMDPIISKDVTVVGKVKGVFRYLS